MEPRSRTRSPGHTGPTEDQSDLTGIAHLLKAKLASTSEWQHSVCLLLTGRSLVDFGGLAAGPQTNIETAKRGERARISIRKVEIVNRPLFQTFFLEMDMSRDDELFDVDKTVRQFMEAERRCTTADDAFVETAYAAEFIDKELREIPCGAILGGLSIRLNFDPQMQGRGIKAKLLDFISVSDETIVYAFGRHETTHVAQTRKVVEEVRNYVRENGGVVSALIMDLPRSWTMQVIEIPRPLVHDAVWDCWANIIGEFPRDQKNTADRICRACELS